MCKKVLEKLALSICDFSLLKSSSIQILVRHNVARARPYVGTRSQNFRHVLPVCISCML